MRLDFGYIYVNGRIVLYDLVCVERAGQTLYVASLSEDPAVRFEAECPGTAIEALMAQLRQPG